MSIRKITTVALFWIFLTHAAIAADITYTDKQVLRNGDFELGPSRVWHSFRGDITSLVAKDGEYGAYLGMSDSAEDRYIFQKLLTPSTIDSATISFDYGAVEHVLVDDPSVLFQVCIAKSKGFDSGNLEESPPLTTIGIIHSETIESTSDWKNFKAELNSNIISDMQAAHDDGEFIFLLFLQTKTHERHRFKVQLDNISFTVKGEQHVPVMGGKIAYLEDNGDGNPHAINILDPNDSSTETIWTHPDGEFEDWSNIVWNPDATRLAFVSDHDFAFYIYRANIFSIKPDGSDLHRIPQTPSQDDIDDAGYPRVTVTGTLAADGRANERFSVFLGVHGTDKGAPVVVSDGDEASFVITDVPVLDDPDVFNQPIIMTYTSNECAGGVEYAFPVAAVNNGNVNIGTIDIYGANCIGNLVNQAPNDLSWTRDGTTIGFSLIGLKKINVESTQEFDISRIEPQGSGFSSNLAWSPVDDRYLYRDFTMNYDGDYLYLAEEGGEAELIVKQATPHVSPVWLPDGSGFIFVGTPLEESIANDENVFHYDLAGGKIERLTYFRNEVIRHISISPDGRYIVFEMHDQILNPKRDLWIIDRINPTEIWPITDSGDCRSPDWSRTDVAEADPDQNPDDDNRPDPEPNPNDDEGSSGGSGGGGGGGGCFVASSLN